jgi:hypothetical protein
MYIPAPDSRAMGIDFNLSGWSVVQTRDSGKPDLYQFSCTLSQQNAIDTYCIHRLINGYDLSLKLVTSYVEALFPEQNAAESEVYDDVAEDNVELILVADTEWLAVLSNSATGYQIGRHPPWLPNALERVQNHRFNNGYGGRADPFEQG